MPSPTSSTDHPPHSNPTKSTETETIDRLLQHYLTLLDEYTSLRSTLNTLQSSMFQSLARANFAAERGVRRYGQDYYDERMQAGRRVAISVKEEGGGSGVGGEEVVGEGEKRQDGQEGGKEEVRIEGPVFTVGVYPPPEPETEGEQGLEPGDGEKGEGEKRLEGQHISPDMDTISKAEKQPDATDDDDSTTEKTQQQPSPGDDTTTKSPNNNRKKPIDPLRWFGILTPLPLRQAHAHAITAVEDIIPRLATLSSEMARVELEVRRARKRRAKAEREAEKKKVAEIEERMGRVDVSV